MGRPTCPSWIDEDAKAAWRQLIPLLEKMRVLTQIDRNALTRYCQLWSRWKKAEQFIQQHGESYPLKDEQGRIKCLQAFPQVATAHKLAAQLTRLEQEFGMTPSARSRIQTSMPAQPFVSDPSKAKWFNRPMRV
jgi:P27 family predicted phage terminase small subunit